MQQTTAHQIRQAEVFACRAGLVGGILAFLLLAAIIMNYHFDALWQVPLVLVLAFGIGYGIGHAVHAWLVRELVSS